MPKKANYQRYKTQIRRADARRRKERIIFVNELKRKPCIDCKQSFPPYVMEYDHVRGEKKDDIGRLCGRSFSLEVILAEIAKCDLVCANCHRKRTWERRQYLGNYTEESLHNGFYGGV